MLSLLVFDGGLSPDYVFDEMQFYELQPLVDNAYRRNKEQWEQARMISYITAQCNSTKKLKMTDILTFPWDTEQDETTTGITNDDIKRLRQKANNYINRNKQNG